MPLPETLLVGAQIRSLYGGGRLTITPGFVVLVPNGIAKRITGIKQVVHRRSQITMFKPKLTPIASTRLVLEDGDVVAIATMGSLARRRVRSALQEAGFQVNEVSTWLAGGSELVKPWP